MRTAPGPDTDALVQATISVCKELALAMVRDAEGGTKLMRITVEGADNVPRTGGNGESSVQRMPSASGKDAKLLPNTPLAALLYLMTAVATLRTKVRRYSFAWALVALLVVPAQALQAPLWIFYREMDFVRQRKLQILDPVTGFVIAVALLMLAVEEDPQRLAEPGAARPVLDRATRQRHVDWAGDDAAMVFCS